MTAPPGLFGDWHPVPQRQLMFVLKGQTDTEMSDGTIRRGGPGTIGLHEDTWGKGHRSWVVGDEDVLLLAVVLPE